MPAAQAAHSTSSAPHGSLSAQLASICAATLGDVMVDSFVVSPVGDAPAIRVGDVLSKSWSLFISRWGPFIGLALVAFAPQLLFSVLVPRVSSLVFVGSILQMACTSLADAA